jgi:hypothetical protein
MTTVTIQVDDDLLARARELAAASRITIPEMLQRLLRVAIQPPLRDTDLPPLTRESRGMLPPMTDDEVKQAVDEHRMRKYGA